MSAHAVVTIPFSVAAVKYGVVADRLNAHPFIAEVRPQPVGRGMVFAKATLAQAVTPHVIEEIKRVFQTIKADNSNRLHCNVLD